ncbi:MAG: helix-turn-helix domain-containing protein [Thermomicrobiales bacterium]
MAHTNHDVPISDDGPPWGIGTIADLVRESLAENDESAHAYLRESWVAGTMAILRATRRRAGLTQDEVAARMGNRQPHIARLERADDAKLSTIWEYLYACGETPLAIETVIVERLRAFVHACPDAPATKENVDQFCHDGDSGQASVEIEPAHVLSDSGDD